MPRTALPGFTLPRESVVRILRAMHTLGTMARALNRSPVYVSGPQKRFALPAFEGAAYSHAHHDLGVPLTGSELQTGLNFASALPELFAGRDMGEDALRVLREILKTRARILADIATELPHVRAAVKWATPLARQSS